MLIYLKTIWIRCVNLLVSMNVLHIGLVSLYIPICHLLVYYLKKKKIRNHQKTKIVLFIILAIFALVMNGGLILLLQNTISSIIIGTVIGFITYFFIFSLLKIDYDRSEQMLSILNINVFFYILINAILFSIIFILYLFLYKEEKEEEEEDYQKICNN